LKNEKKNVYLRFSIKKTWMASIYCLFGNIKKKIISTKTRFEGKLMQFVSLPEQFTPNRPSEHWHCPSIPQVPWPLHVVLGLQNSKTNEKKVSKSTFKSENNENLITY
jgi:hypothetical protein